MGLQLVTDSAADLPENIINQFDIVVEPLTVNLDDKVYRDGETIKPVELFHGMREGRVYKTAQVSVGQLKDLFTKYAQEKQSCLYLAFSSELSGTCQAAVIASAQVREDFPDFEIEIIDTKCASLGEGMVVYKTAQLIEDGVSREEVIEAARFYADHMEHIFTVDDLEYLYRGGRVSKASAFIGGVLNIKPILDVEEGRLIPIEKKKGRKRVFKRILGLMEERGMDISGQEIAISHGDDLEAAEKLADMIRKRFKPKRIIINMISAAIGAHAGPGTLSVFFLNDNYNK